MIELVHSAGRNSAETRATLTKAEGVSIDEWKQIGVEEMETPNNEH